MLAYIGVYKTIKYAFLWKLSFVYIVLWFGGTKLCNMVMTEILQFFWGHHYMSCIAQSEKSVRWTNLFVLPIVHNYWREYELVLLLHHYIQTIDIVSCHKFSLLEYRNFQTLPSPNPKGEYLPQFWWGYDASFLN